MNEELIVIIANRIVDRLNHEGYICISDSEYEDDTEDMEDIKKIVSEVILSMTEGERDD